MLERKNCHAPIGTVSAAPFIHSFAISSGAGTCSKNSLAGAEAFRLYLGPPPMFIHPSMTARFVALREAEIKAKAEVHRQRQQARAAPPTAPIGAPTVARRWRWRWRWRYV